MADPHSQSHSTITSQLPSPQTPTSSLSRSQAAALLLHRRTIRRSLQAWCTEALEPFGHTPAQHHLAIIERLEALTRGDIERLMILAPPGSAKSTYVSQLFPAWFLAQNPTAAVITASHTAELAERFGRRTRNVITEHSATLGYALAPDIQAAGRWETDQGGEFFAAGVGGAIVGRRADLCIIDDPMRSRAEADSEVVRERVWDWWQADLQTRLKPGARVVLIMTRWHQDDLGGRLLNDMASGGRAWEILRLPMEAELDDPIGRAPGDPLWPQWYTDAMRTDAKRDTRTWSALYQQRPVPATGDYFQREWLRPALSLPRREDMRVYGASDYATTAGGGDFTVHVVVGMDPAGQLWLLDLWRGQTASDLWVETFCDLVLEWRPIGWAEEQGQIKAGIGPWLDRRSRERRAFVARRPFPTRGDKGVRAQSIRGRMALEGLHYLASAPWRADLEAELLSFPAGRHDDQVDALGLVGQLLDIMTSGDKPKSPEPRRDSWDLAFERASRSDGYVSWRVA
jgi:predicted phage terminase large subunit-like protein